MEISYCFISWTRLLLLNSSIGNVRTNSFLLFEGQPLTLLELSYSSPRILALGSVCICYTSSTDEINRVN